MTPDTNDYGVAPPNVITSSEAPPLLQVKIEPQLSPVLLVAPQDQSYQARGMKTKGN